MVRKPFSLTSKFKPAAVNPRFAALVLATTFMLPFERDVESDNSGVFTVESIVSALTVPTPDTGDTNCKAEVLFEDTV